MTSDSIPPTLHTASESDDAGQPSAPRGSSDGNAGNTPGRTIRAARERAHLSLEELAMQTKLARVTLDALERDDFEALTEPVYVRGYYRKCAKVLALSETDLIASYERLVVPKAPQAPTKLLIGGSPSMGRPRSRRRSGEGTGGRIAAVVIGAVVLGAAAWFFFNDPGLINSLRGSAPESAAPAAVPATQLSVSPQPQSPHPETPAAETPATSPSAAAPATTDAATSSTAAAPPPPAAATATPSAKESTPPPPPAPVAVQPSAPPPAAASAAASPSATAPAASAATGGGLSLRFASTSWVRIEDADGKLLLSGVIQSGDHQQVRGKPPYSLFIGNAPGVKIEYEGKPVDTTPFVKTNSTARLTIP